MRKRAFFVVMAILVVVSTTVATIGIGETPKEKKSTDSPFVGKVIVVSIQSESNYGGVLGGVEIKKLGGQTFIVGKGLDYGHPADWRVGRTIWIAVSNISSITEFPDIESYKDAANSVSE